MLPNLKQVKLSDFTPGIVSYTGAPVQVIRDAIPGVAAEDIYRCVGLPGGGLGPLPGLLAPITLPTPAGTIQNNSVVVVGAGIGGRVFTSGTTWSSGIGDELHFGLEYQDTASNNVRIHWYKLTTVNGTAVLLAGIVSAKTEAILQCTPLHIVTTRLQSATALANVSVVASWENSAFGDPRTWYFPDPANPTTDTPLADTTHSGSLFAHQGRVLQFANKAVSHGSGMVGLSNEFINFTAPSLSTNMGDQGMVLSPTIPSGYGSWASLGDQGFLLIKQRGGAVVVQGDIMDQPAIVYQANVQSTGTVMMPAVVTPLGVIYADQRSVFLWDGTTSSNISRQLKDGFFLRPDPNAQQLAPRVLDMAYLQSAYWNECVVFPNNYVFNTLTKSWWKLDDTNAIGQVFVSSAQGGTLYSFPNNYAPSTSSQLRLYNPIQPASSYFWRSQPMSVLDGRRVEIREIEIVAQATVAGSTIVISLTDQAGAVKTATFTFSSLTQPMRLRQPIACQGYTIQMSITASSTSSPAPILYSVSLGIREAQSTAAAV